MVVWLPNMRRKRWKRLPLQGKEMSRVLKTMTSWKTGTKTVDGGFLNDRKKWIRNQESGKGTKHLLQGAYNIKEALGGAVKPQARPNRLRRRWKRRIFHSIRNMPVLFVCWSRSVQIPFNILISWYFKMRLIVQSWFLDFASTVSVFLYLLSSSTRLILRWGSCPKRNTPDHSLEPHLLTPPQPMSCASTE